MDDLIIENNSAITTVSQLSLVLEEMIVFLYKALAIVEFYDKYACMVSFIYNSFGMDAKWLDCVKHNDEYNEASLSGCHFIKTTSLLEVHL